MADKIPVLFVGKTVTDEMFAIISSDLAPECEVHYTYPDEYNYMMLVKSFDNIITWGCGSRLQNTGKNILYLENGSPSQVYSMYIDSKGWGNHSSIYKENTDNAYDKSPSKFKYLRKVIGYVCRNYLGINDLNFQKYDKNGPILFAFQNTDDFPFIDAFDIKLTDSNDKMVQLLINLTRSIPSDQELILRPHPMYKDNFYEKLKKFLKIMDFPDNWTLDDCNSKLNVRLSKCSKLISVNSTSILEAMTTGIPIITLGKGLYSGKNLTHEQKPDNIKVRRIGMKDNTKRLNFLCKLLEHNNIAYISQKSVLTNIHYLNFKSLLFTSK